MSSEGGRKPRLLFLCSHNSARSQMAEAILRDKAEEHFEIHSAGLEAQGINPLTIKVMDEDGYDMSGHRSKALDEFYNKIYFGILITVCQDAEDRCPIFPSLGTKLFWNIDDPSKAEGTEEEKLKEFRRAREEIKVKVDEFLEERNLLTAEH